MIHAQEPIIKMANQMTYAVMFEERVFQVSVISDYDLPESIVFSQERRSISLELSNLMMKEMADIEITIPSELLDGEFTATLGGNQIKLINSDEEMETKLHAIIMKSFIENSGIGNSALMIVTGTEVIPEFPSVMMVVMVGGFSILFTLILIGRKLSFR